MSNVVKEFVLLVPGFGASEKNKFLNRLIEGIKCYYPLQKSSSNSLYERTFTIDLTNEKRKELTFQEAHWKDLSPSLNKLSNFEKIVRIFSIFPYLIVSTQMPYIFISLLITFTLFLIWYYGLFATTLNAFISNPPIDIKSILGNYPAELIVILKDLKNSILNFTSLGTTCLTIIAILSFSKVNIDRMIDIIFASKCYLENDKNIQSKIEARIREILDSILESPVKYDKITVVSHSFGVVLGTDVLAKYNKNQNIHFVSLGGPLILASAKSKIVKEARQCVLNNDKICSWIDIYSKQDWLCTKSFENVPNISKVECLEINATVQFFDRLSGASHDLYFDNEEVIKKIIGD